MAKTGKAPKVPETVDADAQLMQLVPELLPTQTEGMTIREFLTSLVPFFTHARELELAAKRTLDRARSTLPPTSAAEDGDLQVHIRQASADRKVILDHWEITSLVYRFQRRLVAARERGAMMLEEAANLWQQQHNTYAEQERRRAQREQERQRQESEAQAQRDRDAELQRLEAQALKAEAGSADLSEREQKFVEFYIVNKMADVDAARAAGYKDPKAAALRILTTPKIIAACKAKQSAVAIREQASAVKEAPLDVRSVDVKPQLEKVGTDRTTKTMEIFDARLLVEAVIGGRHGIPADMLMPNPVKGNDYARNLGDVINRWPGCRLKTKTTTV